MQYPVEVLNPAADIFRMAGHKVAEARVGKWNQGVVWSRDGKTLLAQNMAENALSILSFDGKTLGVTGEIKVKGGPAGLRTAER